VVNRISRLVHHRPILYTFTATFFGVSILPLVIFLLVICGSVGFGVVIFVIIEAGLFSMAVIALIASLIVPVFISLILTSISYAVYKTVKALKEFVWDYFGGPFRTYRAIKQRFTNAISFFRQDKQNTESPTQTSENNSFNPHGRHQPDRPIDGQVTSYPSFSDELEVIQRRMNVAALHEESSEELGVAEGVLLCMADFMHNLTSLLFAIFMIYTFINYLKRDE